MRDIQVQRIDFQTWSGAHTVGLTAIGLFLCSFDAFLGAEVGGPLRSLSLVLSSRKTKLNRCVHRFHDKGMHYHHYYYYCYYC